MDFWDVQGPHNIYITHYKPYLDLIRHVLGVFKKFFQKITFLATWAKAGKPRQVLVSQKIDFWEIWLVLGVFSTIPPIFTPYIPLKRQNSIRGESYGSYGDKNWGFAQKLSFSSHF